MEKENFANKIFINELEKFLSFLIENFEKFDSEIDDFLNTLEELKENNSESKIIKEYINNFNDSEKMKSFMNKSIDFFDSKYSDSFLFSDLKIHINFNKLSKTKIDELWKYIYNLYAISKSIYPELDEMQKKINSLVLFCCNFLIKLSSKKINMIKNKYENLNSIYEKFTDEKNIEIENNNIIKFFLK